ncbi:MAG: hypothetical protein ACOYT4_02785 [Nanoarchaeota archaeon]
MKLKEILKELNNNENFKKFKKQNPDAYLSAGFFVLDFNGNEHNGKYQLDFFIPKKKKIAIFEYPFENFKIDEGQIENAEKLADEIKVDIPDLFDNVKKIHKKNNYEKTITKIIAILKDNQWNLTCMSSDLNMTRIKINSLTGSLDSFEKLRLMDFMRIGKT